MDLVTWTLTLATLASLMADVFAIIKGKKWQGVILLIVSACLAVGLGLEARHAAQVEAENKILTDAQARARRLLTAWTNTDKGFDPQANSAGRNEGIVVATSDLMEDIKCRPEALHAALDRIEDARNRAGAVTGSDFDITLKQARVWQDAAFAAFEQVRGVAEVPPNC